MSARKIIVVGLGPGNPGHLTAAALDTIRQAPLLYLRTAKHPTVPFLPAGPRLEAFDWVYDRGENFSQVYATIVNHLLDAAQQQPAASSTAHPVVYAVPGHPLVGEASVIRLLERAEQAGVPVEVVDGLSFLEPCCTALRLDPLAAGLLLLDATELAGQAENHLPRQHGLELSPLRPLLVGQLYNQRLAGAVKLALMEGYPDDHPVTLLRGAGVPDEQGRLDIPLYELDRHPEWTDHLTCAYLPPRPIVEATGSFANAHYIVARLRAPDGCQWDRRQTHASLKRHLIEEAYEVVHALDEAPHELPQELGDLLLQILLHAQIAAEAGEWSIADVMHEMSEKLIRRHPHIFLDPGAPAPVWEEIKQAEKTGRGRTESVLAGVPPAMPALQQAQALQRKAGELGFEWPSYEDILDKLVEEVGELRQAAGPDELVEEFGDVLAVLASAARWHQVDAEEALRRANHKFRRRFEEWERLVEQRRLDPRSMSLPQLQALWDEARAILRQKAES